MRGYLFTANLVSFVYLFICFYLIQTAVNIALNNEKCQWFFEPDPRPEFEYLLWPHSSRLRLKHLCGGLVVTQMISVTVLALLYPSGKKMFTKLELASPQNELGSNCCPIILGYSSSCINSFNNLTRIPYYIPLYSLPSRGERRGADCDWLMTVGGRHSSDR